jgi:Baculovirus polyhedron envelope protein, PEP, C terminus
MRYRLTLVGMLAGLVLLPGTADAKTSTLQGQIVGAAYAAGAKTAVPVLLRSASARRNKLRTPLALLLVPSSSTVRAGGRAVRPMALRAGDVFKAKATVSRAARRAVYPSITLRKGALSVSKRGSAPSATELQDQINALSAALSQFANAVVAQLGDVRGQLAAMRLELAGLSAAVDALRAQTPNLPAGVQGQINTLTTQISTIQSQLTSLTSQLSTVSTTLAGVTSTLAGIAPGQLTQALTDITTLQTLVGGVDVPGLSSQVSALATKIGAVGGVDLQTQLNTLNGLVTTAQGRITYLCSTAQLVKGNPLLGLAGLSNVTACP